MEEITIEKNDLTKKYQIKNIQKVDEYLFIETDITSLIITKDTCYDIGKYSCVYEIYMMRENLMAVLGKSGKQELINVETKEIILSQRAIMHETGIFKVDDDYVCVIGYDYDNELFNIRTKEFVEPKIDLDIKFNRKIGTDLFHYEKNDYMQQIYQNFVVDKDGKIVYECGDAFPYFHEGDLITSNSKIGITIVHDVLGEKNPINTITKSDVVSSNALIHTTNEKADSIIFIMDNKLKVFNFNFELLNEYPLDVEADDYKIQLWEDIVVVIVTKNQSNYCIAIPLKNGIQIKHKGIWILPLDGSGKQVIRGCDASENGENMFTLYDEDGIEYTHHCAKDCYNLESNQMNKYLYRNVDGTKNSLVYNIDTREEKTIPWNDPKFKITDDEGYANIGCGFRNFRTWEDVTIDFFDEDLNIILEGVEGKKVGIRSNDFAYDLVNNLLLLTIPKSSGPKTYYRKVVLDKEQNILYDSYEGYLSFVGNYLQIEEQDKTTYIDSKTGNVINNASLLVNDEDMPKILQLSGSTIKLLH